MAISLERNVFPKWIGHGLYGFEATAPFLDIGTPDSYASTAAFFFKIEPAVKLGSRVSTLK
ncbi:MAG TPA: hypothetical protein VM783_02460 [Candidatus Acidoferrum sp.]|nr:hypothetical protein [Candidatus Acidoferrum sp.]